MSTDFSVLNARARGLAGRLLSRGEIETLAGLRDPAALAAALAQRARLAPAPPQASLAQVELAVRRDAARVLHILARWSAGENPALAVCYALEERRSLRAMLRGALQGASAEARLAGLIPTPRLPERVLHELARQSTPREIAAHLLVLDDPHAARLHAASAEMRPDPGALERVLAATMAERLRAAATRGDRVLREHVAARIDFDNAQGALQLAAEHGELDAPGCFSEGGAALGREAFVAAAQSGSPARAWPVIARALARSALARAFVRPEDDAPRREAAAHQVLLAALRRHARLDPLSSAPLLAFLSRLEAQSRDVLRLVLGVRLAVPVAQVREGLLTPWH